MMSTTAAWSVNLADHVQVVAPSPDGTAVALGSLGGDAMVLDALTGELQVRLDDHAMGVLAAAWSAGGDRLALGGQDGLLRVYGPGQGRLATVPLGGWVSTVAWSPSSSPGSGELLAVGAGRTVVVVDAAGKVLRRYPDQPSTVTEVAWSADGSRLGVAAYGGIRWYDPGTRRDDDSPARTFEWKGSLLSLAVSPTGKWACCGSQDATVHIWKLWSADELAMSGYPSKIERLAFRHDGRWLAVACANEITMWDFAGRGPSGTKPARGEAHDDFVMALAWEPSGDRLATGGADGRVTVWPSPTRAGAKLKPVFEHSDEESVSALAWARSGGPLFVGYADGRVIRVEPSDG